VDTHPKFILGRGVPKVQQKNIACNHTDDIFFTNRQAATTNDLFIYHNLPFALDSLETSLYERAHAV